MIKLLADKQRHFHLPCFFNVMTAGYREVCPLGRGRTEIVMSTLPEVTGVDVNPPQEQSEQQPHTAGETEALFDGENYKTFITVSRVALP